MSNFYLATVCDTKDPQNLGRVQVQLTMSGKPTKSAWLPVMTPHAGKGVGFWCLPDLHDQVIVMYLEESMHNGYVLGTLWHNGAKPPKNGENPDIDGNKDGKNALKMIKTKAGTSLVIDDTAGKEKVVITSKDGKTTFTMDAKEKAVTLKTDHTISLTAKKGIHIKAKEATMSFEKTLGMKAAGIIAKSDSKAVNIKASQGIVAKGSAVSLN